MNDSFRDGTSENLQINVANFLPSENPKNEQIIEIKLGSSPKNFTSQDLLYQKNPTIHQSRSLDHLSKPLEDYNHYLSQLLAKINGEDSFGKYQAHLPALIKLDERQELVVLSVIEDKPYADRIVQLCVPLLYLSSGEKISFLMNKIFWNSFESDPVACAIAGTWLLRESQDREVYYQIQQYVKKCCKDLPVTNNFEEESLPLFIRGLLHTKNPIALGIVAINYQTKEYSYYDRFVNFLLTILLQLLPVGHLSDLEEFSFARMRSLLRHPSSSIFVRSMIYSLAKSQDPKNHKFLKAQLYAKRGWLGKNGFVAGKRKLEIRQALGIEN